MANLSLFLPQFDRDQFEEKFVDMKWFESKKGFTFGNNPVESEVFMEYSA